jgi:hypothetical protein
MKEIPFGLLAKSNQGTSVINDNNFYNPCEWMQNLLIPLLTSCQLPQKRKLFHPNKKNGSSLSFHIYIHL